jgi:hypothetical protein
MRLRSQAVVIVFVGGAALSGRRIATTAMAPTIIAGLRQR